MPESELVAIATRAATRVPMELHRTAEISSEHGVAGDFRGKPSPRQVTVIAEEGWRAACDEVGTPLDWTLRRANLLVRGIDLRDSVGSQLRIGNALLEVTEETDPCRVMDLQHDGLRAALEPEWRGGVCCRVVGGGRVSVGDAVAWESATDD